MILHLLCIFKNKKQSDIFVETASKIQAFGFAFPMAVD